MAWGDDNRGEPMAVRFWSRFVRAGFAAAVVVLMTVPYASRLITVPVVAELLPVLLAVLLVDEVEAEL